MSLYLKYRPQDFSTIVGQDHAVTTLKNALRRNALTHAYLFAGPRGTGKTSLARIISKAINCMGLRDGYEPCNQCSICKDITRGRLVDLIEIDAASNRGIDEIRELREKIQFSPTHAKAKVYIIDEVHMLTKEAFNALLKTLEEPPEHAYFILATTEAHKIPETVLSRCQQFTFKRISAQDIKKRLEEIAVFEKITAEPEALNLIAKIANGSLRDAIGLLEQMNLDSQIQYDQVVKTLGLAGAILVETFFQALLTHEAGRALDIISQVNSQGRNLHQFTAEFLSFLREQMLINIENQHVLRQVIELIEIFSVAKTQISQALIPQLPLEIAVLKICSKDEEALIKPKAQVSAQPQSVTASEPANDEEFHELNFETIKNNWQRVIQSIPTPFIRVSFSEGEPVRFEKGELHMDFKSKSMMEKIENKANQSQIQGAFQSVFNQKIKLRLELKKVNLKPMTDAAENSDAPTLADMAKEVFGG